MLWIFWLRPFLRTIACALGPTTKSGTTVTSLSTLKDQSLDEKETFKIYYDFEDKVSKLQGYRTLALNRGEKLGVIKVAFKHNLEKMHRFYSARFKQKNDYIEEVINQSLKKKIIPAMERRIRSELTEAAEMVRFNFSLKIFEAFS